MGKRTIDLKTEDTLYIGGAKVQLIKNQDNWLEFVLKQIITLKLNISA